MKQKYLILALMALALALPGCQGCPIAPPPAPSPPSDLAGITVSPSEINLTWKDNSSDETGFYIYRKTTDNYSKVAVTEANSISYNDTGLNSDTTYWYKVCAYNKGGNSEFSNEISTTTPSGIPSAPTNLTGNAAGYDQINLAWQDNSDDEDGFKVFKSFGGTNYEEILDLAPNSTSCNIYQYSNTTYWYYISAYNSFGSAASNSIQVTTPAEPPEVEILNYHMEEEWLDYWDEWETRIVGNVRNNTDQTLTIWIAGKFFDYNDIMVKKSYDLLSDVGSGETWQFIVYYWGERIKRIEAWVDDYY